MSRAVEGTLVDFGCLDVERQAQASEQLAPIARGRGEDETAAGHPSFSIAAVGGSLAP